MRVLHVLPTRVPSYGGPVRVAEALVAGLQRAGHAAALFPSRDGEGPLPGRTGYWSGLESLRCLGRAIQGTDLVHVHCLWTVTGSAAAVLARVHGVPYVVTPHGMLDRWSLRRSARRKQLYAWAVERRNLDLASAVHFFNAEEREEAAGFGIRAPTWVLPNGVDADAFASLPGREVLEAHLPEVRGRTVALFLGRIHPKKGFDLLLPALARARQREPRLHLVVAGPDEGGYRGRVERETRRLGLRASVSFVGEVREERKRVVLGGADLFVLPSHQEGDSVAVKEALASGLPVILTPACHLPEVVHCGAGTVVAPRAEALEEALLRLAASPELRAAMGQAARALVSRSYRWESIVRQLVALYEGVLAGAGARSGGAPGTAQPLAGGA